jgi:mannan endo-1,4-beta-mannosidase
MVASRAALLMKPSLSPRWLVGAAILSGLASLGSVVTPGGPPRDPQGATRLASVSAQGYRSNRPLITDPKRGVGVTPSNQPGVVFSALPEPNTGPRDPRLASRPSEPGQHTATASPRPPTAPPTEPLNDGVIHTDGHGHLTLNGKPYQFVGVDAYELATLWSTNLGCGAEIDALGAFFNSLSANSVVRFWAFQDFTRSRITGARDWTPLDRVVHAAESAHERLIFVLADQWSNCPGERYKDAAFYEGGYRSATPTGELEPYWSWVRDVVSRYKDSPAVGMWEPMNEAQGDCISFGAQTLESFFDAVGGLIKSIDPRHLVESGLLGTGQCGVTGGDYITAQETPNIDVVSYHDYGDPASVPAPLAVRLQQAQELDKPLIVGEVGFLTNCSEMHAKQAAQAAAGVAGFLPWNWDGPWSSTCGF